nr:uncharacterized protein LOC109150621 [Ipomoea trifida]
MSNPHSITETQSFKAKWSLMKIKLSALQTHLADELSSARHRLTGASDIDSMPAKIDSHEGGI